MLNTIILDHRGSELHVLQYNKVKGMKLINLK